LGYGFTKALTQYFYKLTHKYRTCIKLKTPARDPSHLSVISFYSNKGLFSLSGVDLAVTD